MPHAAGGLQAVCLAFSVRLLRFLCRARIYDAWVRGQRLTHPCHRRLACRYEIVKASGKGIFSSVVTAHDKLRQAADGSNPKVAIKMIRANATMYKAGKQELEVLQKLADGDPDNRKHVIRLLRSFEYRNHLCMVRHCSACKCTGGATCFTGFTFNFKQKHTAE